MRCAKTAMSHDIALPPSALVGCVGKASSTGVASKMTHSAAHSAAADAAASAPVASLAPAASRTATT